jgi:Class II Aldolase and Adducin N-terminal domain
MPPSIAALEQPPYEETKPPAKKLVTHGPTSIPTSRPMDTLTIGTRDGTLHMPIVPSFTNPLSERSWSLEHMAGAFRLFGKFGFGEGAAGHISLKDPVNPEWMWINPYGMHFSQIKKSDLVCIDEEGYVVEDVGARKPVNTAGVHIHRELHKARPDIKAACHAHSIYGMFAVCSVGDS